MYVGYVVGINVGYVVGINVGYVVGIYVEYTNGIYILYFYFSKLFILFKKFFKMYT